MWAKFKEGRHQAGPARNIMSGQHYCLRWNNYQSNMTSVFHQLLRTEAFVDVTLSCNDSCLKAHKVVLSACSSYFQKLLMQNPCNHPTIIMPPDVSFRDLRVIIDFVYQGEIDVDQAQLQSLLKTADQLKIKGLCEVSDTREQEQEEVQPVFARQVNLFASESIKTVTFENVLQPNSFKNPFINSEASFNQITKLKHSSSPPPVFTGSDNYLRHPLTDTKDFACGPDPPSGSCSKRPSKSKSVGNVSSVAGGGGRVSPGPVRKKSRATVRDRAVQSDAEPMSGISLPTVTMPGLGDGVRHEPQVWRWIQGNNGERVPECITVATSTEEDQKNVPMMILERPLTTMVGSMVVHNMPHPLSPHLQDAGNSNTSVHSSGEQTPPEMDIPLEAQPAAPSATLVENLDLSEQPEPEAAEIDTKESGNVEVKFETLRSVDQSGDTVDMDEHMSADRNQEESDHSMQTMMITPELLGLLPSGSGCSGEGDMDGGKGGKGWTQEDMDAALDALKNHNMSLTRASATYGIPSTTLWQRAHRMGIDTPKKEGSTKNWTEDSLNNALEALRTGTISANKASKAYGIPSSTLYKIARREGIRLAAPFNAAPTTWTQEDLDRALESIRSGQSSVQKASTEFGIPTGTLYGRCKREGIELSRSNPTPWSEDAMGEALEAVRVGQMSINQAAIHYNLPYSSLYGRFKRGKYDTDESTPGSEISQGMMLVNYPDQYSGLHTFQNQPGS